MPQSNVSQDRSQMQTTFRDLALMSNDQKTAAYQEWLGQKELDDVKKKAAEQARKDLARIHKDEFEQLKTQILGEKLSAGLQAVVKSRKKPGKE